MTKATRPHAEPTNADAPSTPKGLLLHVPPDKAGKGSDRGMAEVAIDGIAGNARAVVSFGDATFGELSLTDCAAVLRETAQGLNGGDLSAAVTMLAAQAVALNAMFGELARVGQANMFKAPDFAERYLRLAFKAQSQSRATLETLAAIKNPPVVFARQANISNGPQQVNNGWLPANANSTPAPAQYAHRGAHTANQAIEQTELLEASNGERLDAGAQGKAGGADPHLAPVATLGGAAND